MNNHEQFLAGFESHLKLLLLANGALGECYLQSAYSACAFKALGLKPRLIAGRFGIKGSGRHVPHAWVMVGETIFDPSGKANIEILWDDCDEPEYLPFSSTDSDPDLMGQWLDCRTVTEYILNAPSPKAAFQSAASFFNMLGIKGGFPKVSDCMDSIRWERLR